MTNVEIIEKVAREKFGNACVDKMIADTGEPELHSAKGWINRGYIVKKGEKSHITARLWNKKAAKDTVNSENTDSFRLVKSYLFTKNQVERLKDI